MNKLGLVMLFSAYVLLTSGASRAIACDFPPNGFFQEPRLKFTGLYANEGFGYTVVIPKDMAGYDSPAPGPHNGFGIAFGRPPQSYVLVQGEPNSFDDGAPVDAALRSLSYLREDAKMIESVRIKRSHLGTLQAAELLVTYTCPGSTERYTLAAMFALSPRKGTAFEVTLYCLASGYPRDRAVLDEILRSWKYIGR